MKNLIHLFLLLLAGSYIIGMNASCSDDNDCSMTGRPLIYCTVYTIDPATGKTLNDTIDSLTITALGTDSIILNNVKKVHSLSLPLRYTSDSTVFILHYDYKANPRVTDTLYIVQRNIPYFQSIDCGYLMKQTILKDSIGKTKNKRQIFQLDSTYVKNKEANTNEIQNIQLFYKYRN